MTEVHNGALQGSWGSGSGIRMFLPWGPPVPDPDPLVGGAAPDPVPDPHRTFSHKYVELTEIMLVK
jgi:hypothetical protein